MLQPTKQLTHLPKSRGLLPDLLVTFIIAPLIAGLPLPYPAEAGMGEDGQPLVAVIEGDLVGPGGESMRPDSQQRAQTMRAALRQARIPFVATRDTLVEKYGLPGVRVAILPYNRAVSAAELARLEEFSRSGGRLIICLLAPPPLLATIGVQAGEVVTPTYAGQFAEMALDPAAMLGLPQTLANPNSRVRKCGPRGDGRVVGQWRSSNGAATGHPAVIVSSTGAFINGSLEETGDRAAQAALIRALCAHYAPEIWRQALPTSPADVAPLGIYPSLADMKAALEERQRAGEDVSTPLGAVHEVIHVLGKARQALLSGDVPRAAMLSLQAETQAQRAYWMSYPSLDDELRGVWASPEVAPDWNGAIKVLGEANLNAVFPYVCSAGVAWYRSDLLPRASDNDCLTRITQAARQSSVAVHARMLNLYAMGIPDPFRRQLAKEGRLMVSSDGKITNWLCPVNPKNRQLQARLATEILTRYPVSGLQFDYFRYPGEKYCFCPTCRQSFQKLIGRKLPNMAASVRREPLRSQFLEWRRRQITSLVAEVVTAARKAAPNAAISAAVFLNWEKHRDWIAQDWKTWVDQGLLDFVCPMNYTPDNDRFTEYVQNQIRWVEGKTPLCPGIGVNADNMKFGGPQQLLDQITIARNLRTDGWVVFNYSQGLVRDYLPYLRLGATRTPASFNPFRRVLMPPTDRQ